MIEKLPLLFWPAEQTLTILIFHRVLSAPDPLRPGEPDVARFDRLMRFLSENFTVLPLIEAVARLQKKSLPRRACAITFDDGYADNLTNALPILEKYRLPATVFIATGYLDGGRMFNDAVIDAIAATRKDRLDLRVIGLGEHPIETTEQKRLTITAILNQIKYSLPEQRNQQIDAILAAADCDPLPTDLMLTRQQVCELSKRGVEIGGHTVSHTILTSLDDDQAFEEIRKGKEDLEAIIGRPVTSFAYPNGKPGRDFADRHVPLVKMAGFKRAVSTAWGVGRFDTDVFQLPRYTPWGEGKLRIALQMLRNTRVNAASVA